MSSDLLEGRGVGTRGGQLATEYLATQFALAGAKPAGDNGTYFQRVPLVGVEPSRAPAVTLSASGKGTPMSFRWLRRIRRRHAAAEGARTQFDAEAVFVGHGIVAPEFQWDDFKGVDVRGKVVVLFTNEPRFGRPEVLRRARAHLLRPLDLQVSSRPLRNGRRRGASSSTPRPPPATAGRWCETPGARENRYVKLEPGAAGAGLRRLGDRGGR